MRSRPRLPLRRSLDVIHGSLLPATVHGTRRTHCVPEEYGGRTKLVDAWISRVGGWWVGGAMQGGGEVVLLRSLRAMVEGVQWSAIGELRGF